MGRDIGWTAPQRLRNKRAGQPQTQGLVSSKDIHGQSNSNELDLTRKSWIWESLSPGLLILDVVLVHINPLSNFIRFNMKIVGTWFWNGVWSIYIPYKR